VYYRIKNKIINKNNMEKKIFQSGGPIIDEDELFEDGSVAQGQEPVSGGALDGELVGGTDNFAQDPPEITDLDEPAGYVAPLESSDLTEGAVLTAYGVQGGVITYEDGSSARFQNLILLRAEILSSLVSESVPSIEEKYNLDEDEVNLLNTLRDSDMTSEEFINRLS
jgi:hypothetical protein